MADTLKISFNFKIESKHTEGSIVSNVGRVFVKEMVLTVNSKKINTVNNIDIYGNYKYLYLSEKDVTRSCSKVCNKKTLERLELVQ